MSSSAFKTNYQRAITIIQSDTVEIPCPWLMVMTGASTSVGLNTIQVTGANFYTLNIKAGDIIINKTANTISYVRGIIQADALDLVSNIFTVQPSNFELYYSQENAGISYDAPVIYNPHSTHDYTVLTAGGDIVKFDKIPVGVFPVQIKRINTTGSTASSTTIALW